MTVRKQRRIAGGKCVNSVASAGHVEPLDRRTLLSVSLKFNIIDPTNKYLSIRPQLQAQLNAAGAEWSTHLLGNATLEYDVQFSEAAPPATSVDTVRMAMGAAKSAQVV